MSRRLSIPVLLGVTISCVHGWGRTVDAPIQKGGIAFRFPAGWQAIDRGGWMVATRDGTRLQVLAAGDMKVASQARARGDGAFPVAIVRGLVADLDCPSPELRSEPFLSASIAGREGFRSGGRCRTAEGPDTMFELAWAPAGEGAWFVAYAAPARHYFDQDLLAFERTLESTGAR